MLVGENEEDLPGKTSIVFVCLLALFTLDFEVLLLISFSLRAVKWYCRMNKGDTVNNSCAASEKDNRWYHNFFRLEHVNLGDQKEPSAPVRSPDRRSGGTDSDEEDEAAKVNKEALVKNDAVLTQLLGIGLDEKSATGGLVSKYYFHETLLEAAQGEGADEAKDDISSAENEKKPAAVARVSDATGDGDGQAPPNASIEEAKGTQKRGTSDASFQTPTSRKKASSIKVVRLTIPTTTPISLLNNPV